MRDHLHYTGKLRCATHNMCIHRYKTSREIPLVFHNGSELTLHFIIKKLTEEFNGQIECLVEKTENDKTFSTKIQKDNEYDVLITYKIRSIDSIRFMATSLSTVVDNLTEGLRKGKRKNCKSSLEYVITKDSTLTFTCMECDKF